MNWDTIQGTWHEYEGRIRQRWGKLTDNDLTLIGGSRERLVGFLQERYGKTRDQLEREIEEFCVEQD